MKGAGLRAQTQAAAIHKACTTLRAKQDVFFSLYFLISHANPKAITSTEQAVDFEVHSALVLSVQCNPSHSASSVKPLDSNSQANSTGHVSEVFVSETG